MRESVQFGLPHEKQVHEFAVVGNQRRGTDESFVTHLEPQNALAIVRTHAGDSFHRLIQAVVTVVARLGVPPSHASPKGHSKQDRASRHGTTGTPSPPRSWFGA